MLRIVSSILLCFPLLLSANDPDLSWATFFGSSAFQTVDVEVDPSDNFLILGQGGQSGFPVFDPGNGAYFKANPGSSEGVLAKFSPQGERLWATYVGGNCADEVHDMAVLPSGDILVVGSGGACSFPLLNPGNGAFFDNTFAGNSEGFILRFSPTGILKWGTYIGGSGKDGATTITIAENGHFWVGGWTQSSDFPTKWKSGSYNDGSIGGSRDWFIAKFDPDGRQLYTSYYGGSINQNGERPISIAYNSVNGHVTFSGIMGNNNPLFNPGNGAYYATNNSPGFLLEMDSTGARVWATKLAAGSLAFDHAGNLFLGATCSATYLSTYPLTNPGGGALYAGFPSANVSFVQYFAKFDLNHALQWGTMSYDSGIKTYSTTNVLDISIDQNQNLVVVGQGDGSFRQKSAGNGFFQTHQGSQDGTISVFSNTGVHLFGSHIGGSLGTDALSSLAVNSTNEYLVAGSTISLGCSNGNIPLFNPSNAYYDGIGYSGSSGGNLFLGRFSPMAVSGISDDCSENFLNGSLPVTWNDIEASLLESGQVLVEWSTSSEQNNHYFEVERSSDGNLYQAVGTKASKGSSTVEQRYQLVDRTVGPGTMYYRVRQVDIDGSSSLSDVVEVQIDSEDLMEVTYVENGVHISSSSQIQSVILTGINGQELKSMRVNARSHLVSGSELSKGIYLLEVRTNAGISYHKIRI